jgi:hypothetical protein
MADGGISVDLPVHLVPADARQANTQLWVTMDGSEAVKVDRDAGGTMQS